MRAILLDAKGKSREVEVPFPPPQTYTERLAVRRPRRVTYHDRVDMHVVDAELHCHYVLADGTFAPTRETDLAVYQQVGKGVVVDVAT
jgi:hypothetical protein